MDSSVGPRVHHNYWHRNKNIKEQFRRVFLSDFLARPGSQNFQQNTHATSLRIELFIFLFIESLPKRRWGKTLIDANANKSNWQAAMTSYLTNNWTLIDWTWEDMIDYYHYLTTVISTYFQLNLHRQLHSFDSLLFVYVRSHSLAFSRIRCDDDMNSPYGWRASVYLFIFFFAIFVVIIVVVAASMD